LLLTQKKCTPLTQEAHGVPILSVNDLHVSENGKIYFSDATSIPTVKEEDGHYPPLAASEVAIIASSTSGRLLVYDPITHNTSVLVKDLVYANGVALSEKENFVLVVETGKYRVHRYWLKGAKAGTSEIFVDNLPGFPDGIRRGTAGRFWLTCFAPRVQLLDLIHPYKAAKEVLLATPHWMRPTPKRYALVVCLNENGDVIDSFHDPDGGVAAITQATEYDGKLYLGSLLESFVTVYSLEETR